MPSERIAAISIFAESITNRHKSSAGLLRRLINMVFLERTFYVQAMTWMSISIGVPGRTFVEKKPVYWSLWKARKAGRGYSHRFPPWWAFMVVRRSSITSKHWRLFHESWNGVRIGLPVWARQRMEVPGSLQLVATLTSQELTSSRLEFRCVKLFSTMPGV